MQEISGGPADGGHVSRGSPSHWPATERRRGTERADCPEQSQQVRIVLILILFLIIIIIIINLTTAPLQPNHDYTNAHSTVHKPIAAMRTGRGEMLYSFFLGFFANCKTCIHEHVCICIIVCSLKWQFTIHKWTLTMHKLTLTRPKLNPIYMNNYETNLSPYET